MPARMKVTHCLLLSLFIVTSAGASARRGAAVRGDNAADGADASSAGEDDPPAYTIVIDPGHGGRDLGTRGQRHEEKDLALAVALALGERLEGRPRRDVEVVYTREADVFVPLRERAAIANRAGADLFVSIHCNYLGQAGWHGSETYVMGLHTADHNLAVARRENAAVRHEGDGRAASYEFDLDSPMGHILLANFQHAYLERSLLAAEELESSLGRRPGRRSRGVKQAGFVVLKETTMPSVLVELGYLSNPAEEAYLASGRGTEETADALYAGLARYLRALEAQDGLGQTTVTALPVTVPEERRADAPPAIFYYVQLAAASRALETAGERWRRLGTEVRVVREAGMLKYQAGPYTARADAATQSRKARALGFEGAFVVGYREGGRLTGAELDAPER